MNIQIYNPTAAPATGFYQNTPCACYPYNYNNMTYQAPVYQTPQYPAPTNNQTEQIDSSAGQALNMNENTSGVAAQGQGENNNKTAEDKKEDKQKVALTDDYIKTLENYLNSQDKKVRLMGAKELLERFKEDETRKDDAALTALLNKTLQDPADTVKFIGLTALDTGYAAGNNETAQILTQMQSSDSNYGEDASLASKVLLKMSGSQANASVAQANAQLNEQAADTSLNNQAEMSLEQKPEQNLVQNPQIISNEQGISKVPSDDSGILQNGGMQNQNAALTGNLEAV
ncbi:MAG: hypothetical protein LUE64_06580 [Candidatus Gastranaerophilales bacterium]|nr:hypothetical protein [Candidatus Gastranaerophilales bacterium]